MRSVCASAVQAGVVLVRVLCTATANVACAHDASFRSFPQPCLDRTSRCPRLLCRPSTPSVVSFEGTLSVRFVEPFEVGFVGLSSLVLPLHPFVPAVRLQRSCLITV